MPHNHPELCACCGRQARHGPYCIECALLADDIKRARKFTAYEQRALDDAGGAGGALLDEWNRTDLSDLSEDQWRAFLEAVIRGFGASVRQQVREDAIPF